MGHEFVEEVVDKLLGCARDVTKVWLRNNNSVCGQGNVPLVMLSALQFLWLTSMQHGRMQVRVFLIIGYVETKPQRQLRNV